MNFKEALIVLGIEDYAEQIIKSNSSGELFHLHQYVFLAQQFKDNSGWFREWFQGVVTLAQNSWERPQSVFQHIILILLNKCPE